MHKFDYSFLADGLLPANLVNLTANIASLSVKSAVRYARRILKTFLQVWKVLQKYSQLKAPMQ